MAPSCPADARNPVLALCTQSSSQSPGSSAGHGEEMREAPSPFQGKGNRDGEPAWLQPLGTGECEAWGGRVRERGAARVPSTGRLEAGWNAGISGQEGAGHPCPGRGAWPLQQGHVGREEMDAPAVPGFPSSTA